MRPYKFTTHNPKTGKRIVNEKKEGFQTDNKIVIHNGFEIFSSPMAYFIAKNGYILSECVSIKGAKRHIDKGLYVQPDYNDLMEVQ